MSLFFKEGTEIKSGLGGSGTCRCCGIQGFVNIFDCCWSCWDNGERCYGTKNHPTYKNHEFGYLNNAFRKNDGETDKLVDSLNEVWKPEGEAIKQWQQEVERIKKPWWKFWRQK